MARSAVVANNNRGPADSGPGNFDGNDNAARARLGKQRGRGFRASCRSQLRRQHSRRNRGSVSDGLHPHSENEHAVYDYLCRDDMHCPCRVCL